VAAAPDAGDDGAAVAAVPEARGAAVVPVEAVMLTATNEEEPTITIAMTSAPTVIHVERDIATSKYPAAELPLPYYLDFSAQEPKSD
jgi:hypothetical protein